LRSLIANYKLPRKLKLYEGEIPRNVSVHQLSYTWPDGQLLNSAKGMGKVNKKALVTAAFPPHP
jgi:hypothetical protein